MSEQNLRIHTVNDPVYAENGMVIYLRGSGPCWIIDPGLPPQAELMVKYVREEKLEAQAILLTHGHADHLAGVDEVRAALGPVPVYLAKEEWAALQDPMVNLSGLMGQGITLSVTDQMDLVPGETLLLDGLTWQIIDTSGHSPGGRSFYCAEVGTVIVGDALFAGSVGRVDFPGSSGSRLIGNLRERLMSLPDETRVIPGHGPETTIGHERATNPYLLRGI